MLFNAERSSNIDAEHLWLQFLHNYIRFLPNLSMLKFQIVHYKVSSFISEHSTVCKS